MRRFSIALALVLVVAACGDDDATTTTGAGAATTAADSGTATTAAGGATDTTAAGGSGTVGGDIQALLDVYASTPLRLTYLMGDQDEDPETVVMAQDPTSDPIRSSIITGEAKIISNGEETMMCEDGQCIVLAGVTADALIQGLLGPFAASFLLLSTGNDVPGSSLVAMDGTIAGRTGICWQYTPPGTTETYRQCIDDQLGFTLLMETSLSGGGTTRVMELLEYATPTDEDFEPTGPVIGP
ncbi:MAG: hypothetical protein QY307_08015 [Acidimicrobiia bacterium]|nr:MAG: hypothetical protein QY307_08015 [Acidimicrobiia bacterium]